MGLPLAAFILEAVANLGLAGLVLRRNRDSATHQLFALLAVFLVMWATVNYVSFVTTDYQIALWTIRLVMVFAVLQSITFALLMRTFPRATLSISKIVLALLFVIAALGVFISLSPWLFPAVSLRSGQPPQPHPSWGMAIFLPITLGSLIWGFSELLRKNIRARGLEKLQQRYLLFGFLLTFGLLVTLLLYFAIVRQDTRFIPYAPLFTLPLIVATAYTIIRYRLLDIRLAIVRSLSLTALLGAFFGLYALILIFGVPFLANITGIPEGILAATGALFAVVLARYAQDFFRRITDRFLYQKHADYHVALAQVGQALARTINIDEVTDIVLKTMHEVVRTQKTIILLRDESGKRFTPRAMDGVQNFTFSLAKDHDLARFAQEQDDPVIKDELVLQKEHSVSLSDQHRLNTVIQTFESLDIQVIVPLEVKGELTGLILLGNKLSGDPYLHDDIEFLSAFDTQAATALENARLYKESLEFGKRLEVEIDKATKELQVKNKQLQDLMNIKTEFLHIASHQLRTPLTSLRGFLEMQAKGEFDTLPNEERRELQKNMLSGANQLNSIVNDLLDAMELEGGSLNFKVEPVQVEALIEEAIKTLKLNYDKKGLSLVFEKPQPLLPRIEADPGYLRQVFLNVIDNAEKYTAEGGVTVRAALRKGKEVEVTVTDTGIGIDPAEIPKLFGKFVRGQRSERMHTDGSGLGLFIIKKIVEEHHGHVMLESEGVGKGTLVRVTLPLQQPR